MTRGFGKTRAAWSLMLVMLLAWPVLGQSDRSASDKSRFSIGAGMGIPYGVMGMSFEFNPILSSGGSDLSNWYSINVGLGFAVASVGYSLGFRIYPWGRDGAWAPKLSVNYGVVAIVDWDYLVRGFSLGGGCQYRLNPQLSLDADLIFILNHFGFDTISWSELGRLKISFGLRWHPGN